MGRFSFSLLPTHVANRQPTCQATANQRHTPAGRRLGDAASWLRKHRRIARGDRVRETGCSESRTLPSSRSAARPPAPISWTIRCGSEEATSAQSAQPIQIHSSRTFVPNSARAACGFVLNIGFSPSITTSADLRTGSMTGRISFLNAGAMLMRILVLTAALATILTTNPSPIRSQEEPGLFPHRMEPMSYAGIAFAQDQELPPSPKAGIDSALPAPVASPPARLPEDPGYQRPDEPAPRPMAGAQPSSPTRASARPLLRPGIRGTCDAPSVCGPACTEPSVSCERCVPRCRPVCDRGNWNLFGAKCSQCARPTRSGACATSGCLACRCPNCERPCRRVGTGSTETCTPR